MIVFCWSWNRGNSGDPPVSRSHSRKLSPQRHLPPFPEPLQHPCLGNSVAIWGRFNPNPTPKVHEPLTYHDRDRNSAVRSPRGNPGVIIDTTVQNRFWHNRGESPFLQRE
ncbi:hypothetical protein J0895_02960 [Phormidium pseudopriestleyi FRX01]|uniref:Uncharacterized protein n=1 Tax=Phormidium pseudopriestleyi FRX01 TaxID=1759528 RepID=A0ABS3FMF2_9CYAN|nr:hypothetical protein [Phormidium pseudopriestleyi]MBO0348077.1 hypothetical protein [Phormidium pseudopriestleyi FRX01]